LVSLLPVGADVGLGIVVITSGVLVGLNGIRLGLSVGDEVGDVVVVTIVGLEVGEFVTTTKLGLLVVIIELVGEFV
jgi:hypothetical protein